MNANGVLASMCFPTFIGFNGGALQNAPDKDLATIVVGAYNDWHIDEWGGVVSRAGSSRSRSHRSGTRRRWSPRSRRVAAKGCHADDACPRCPLHRASQLPHRLLASVLRDGVRARHRDVPAHRPGPQLRSSRHPTLRIDNLIVLANQVSVLAAQDLMWGPVLRTFPDLKIAWSEGGIVWIPCFLDRCDRHSVNQHWPGQDFGGKRRARSSGSTPRVLHHRPVGAAAARPHRGRHHRVGVRLPALRLHMAHSPELLLGEELNDAGLRRRGIDKITWENAAASSGSTRSPPRTKGTPRWGHCASSTPTSTCPRRRRPCTRPATRPPSAPERAHVGCHGCVTAMRWRTRLTRTSCSDPRVARDRVVVKW